MVVVRLSFVLNAVPYIGVSLMIPAGYFFLTPVTSCAGLCPSDTCGNTP